MAPFHDEGYKGIINQSLFFQHSQHLGPKQFGQGLNADPGHDMENTASAKQTVSNDRVDVWMPFGVITKSLDSHHHTKDAVLQADGHSEKDKQAIGSRLT